MFCTDPLPVVSWSFSSLLSCPCLLSSPQVTYQESYPSVSMAKATVYIPGSYGMLNLLVSLENNGPESVLGQRLNLELSTGVRNIRRFMLCVIMAE